MARTALKVLIIDVVLLVGEYYVVQDLQWRTSYATSLHSACPQLCGYTPSFSYNILTQFFTMAGNGVSLTSPPTLDWIQLFTAALLVVNLWFVYTYIRQRAPKASRVTN